LAQAAISEGKYAQAFPSFGPERRGAPVQAFVRIDKKPILLRAEVSEPDMVVVLDPGLLKIVSITSGLKDGGTLVINTRDTLKDIESGFGNYQIAVVDAISIARALLGVPIVNTTMIGALIRATEVVSLESLVEPLQKRFGRLAEKNINAMKKAYQDTLVKERV
jgi:pyruvate ferredoxin oxidoreductase gamma subunit